jgi:Protein of unknown function (DUF3106)
MNRPLRRRGLPLFLCGAIFGFGIPAPAQTPSAPVNSLPAAVGAGTNAPPIPPPIQPRIEMFRKLLAMTSAGQQAWLSNRPAEVRAPLEAKIQEYLAMKPDEREAILRATELHEYLEIFLKEPPVLRAAQLPQVPQPYRQIVSDRLRMFDILPPDLQRDVLAGKSTADYFLNPSPVPPIMGRARPAVSAPPLPPAPWDYLGQMSAEQKQAMYTSFQNFFDLNEEDRRKILAILPPDQRAQVAQALRDLENLPPDQRKQGLQSLSRLASMTEPQRQAFFTNAMVWQQLPATERQTWRKMVVHLPPALPVIAPRDGFPPSASGSDSRDAANPATNPAN